MKEIKLEREGKREKREIVRDFGHFWHKLFKFDKV
jgi:hypothetical protein